MEDVYAEFGLYEAHMESMRSGNAMLIEWCGVLELFLLFPLHILFSFDMQDGL